MNLDTTNIILLFILGFAAVADLRLRKIPNWLTGPSILVGIGLHTYLDQWDGLIFSLEGAGLGLGLFLITYAVGWMGAGDVKLYAAVGSFLGPVQTLSAALIIAIAGGILAFGALAYHQGWRKMSSWILSFSQSLFLTRSLHMSTPCQAGGPDVPYAVAIGLGTIGSYWWYPLG